MTISFTPLLAMVSCMQLISLLNFLYMHACIVASKPFFEEFPRDVTAVEGNKVLLPVKVIGSPQPTLTWYHDNTRLGNDYNHEISSDGDLTIITAEMRHSGTYRLVAIKEI